MTEQTFEPSKESEELREEEEEDSDSEDEYLFKVTRGKNASDGTRGPYSPGEHSKGSSEGSFFVRRVLPSVLVGGTAVLAAPVVIGAMGFTAGGITAGSMAASMMSSAAIANGGGVAAGSLVAVLQSAGAVGFTAGANAGIFAAATTLTAGVVELGSRINDMTKERTDDKKRKRGNFM